MKHSRIILPICISLLSTFTVTSQAMAEGASTTVQQLRDARIEIEEFIFNHPLEVVDAQKILLIGNTGSGKSTLTHLLMEKPLYANEEGDLLALEEIPGSEIGVGLESLTNRASFQQLPQGSIVCDLPGRNDTKGPLADIIHAYTLHLLLKHNAKILLVASETSLFDRASEFRALIEDLTKMIPVKQLKESTALVITKQGSRRFFDAMRILQELGRSESLNNDAKELLAHWLNEHEREPKIFYFPSPIATGFYDARPYHRELLQGIDRLTAIFKPQIKSSLSAQSMQVIDDLASSLNGEFTAKVRELSDNKILPLIPLALASVDDDGEADERQKIYDLHQIRNHVIVAYNWITYLHDAPINFIEPLQVLFSNEDNLYVDAHKQDILFLHKIKPIHFAVSDWVAITKPIVDILNNQIAAENNKLRFKTRVV